MSVNERSTEVAAVPATQQAREEELAEQGVASFGNASDARLKQLMQALTRHLHGFLREVRILVNVGDSVSCPARGWQVLASPDVR